MFLLFSGAGVLQASWRSVQAGVARFATSLAFERAGCGNPVSASAVVAQVRGLVQSLRLAPPYVLVGHSVGALHAQLYARAHPREVAAVVLVEPTGADERHRLHAVRERLCAALARLQRTRPQELRANLDAELDGLAITARELAAAGPFPDVPLWVVVGRLPPPPALASVAEVRERRRMHRRLLRLSPRGGRRVPMRRSGHFPQWSEPRRLVALLRVVAATVRTGPGPATGSGRSGQRLRT